ncbi:MAG: PHA/PHB synthase family protein [Alphaproteobacteria bacterium]
MVEQANTEVKGPDPVEYSANMAKIAERSQRLLNDFLLRQSENDTVPLAPESVDPLNIGSAFLEMTRRMMADPARLVQAQVALWQDYMSLWQNAAQRFFGGESSPVIAPAHDDRRFSDPAWQDNGVFDYMKQSYLLTARWLQKTVRDVEGLDDQTAKKVDFYTRQFVDAMSPTNFLLTNPEVLRATYESNGENLVKGLENLLADLEKGNGKLRIKQVPADAFEVGVTLATTPGKVVYQNDLLQLIQYSPTTETVHQTPLLIIPPWINKYYILDLRPKNSFVKWAVERGITVFMVSWVNPDANLAKKSFEDYMLEGPLACLDAIEKATGERQANVIGYCLGGTLLASTLAYMAAKEDDRFKAATFFTSMVDFEEAGELSVFIDEEQLASLEEKMSERGYLEGTEMAATFNMLRANDLIWSFVINNYLLGKEPFPFDLLYWNADSTRMPAAMHSFYLRKMYLENKLVEPGGITLAGVPIDLTRIETPTFILSTREDHIAPWKSTYAATQIYKGPVRFCLAASGHIAGVVNAAASNKYSHWVNPRRPKSPDRWLAGATEVAGSWWPEWYGWLARHSGPQIPARQPGDGKLKPVEEAPGSYVQVRLK